jgi:hypothetical protein
LMNTWHDSPHTLKNKINLAFHTGRILNWYRFNKEKPGVVQIFYGKYRGIKKKGGELPS